MARRGGGRASLGCSSRRSVLIVDDPPARSPICRRLEQCPVVRTSPRCPPLVVYPPYRRTTFFFAYHLSPASTSRLLSVSFTIGRLLPGAPCFAAVDICLSYNPGSPCFLSAPLIHPSTPLCILLFPSSSSRKLGLNRAPYLYQLIACIPRLGSAACPASRAAAVVPLPPPLIPAPPLRSRRPLHISWSLCLGF